jgi:hypothetical protein
LQPFSCQRGRFLVGKNARRTLGSNLEEFCGARKIAGRLE